ncbi:hypothetical protein MTR67_008509 [Solanum verrucosum]|uniref:Uncharacterized protein n=1 Tax=Solanum verrucosum TaxID=315347 RepID=A0AAF0Q847_SOLVR|nr:hypothetical protein MTR67_008509 [Solanum verrucosum]
MLLLIKELSWKNLSIVTSGKPSCCKSNDFNISRDEFKTLVDDVDVTPKAPTIIVDQSDEHARQSDTVKMSN